MILINSVTSPSWKKITADFNIIRTQGFEEHASKLFHIAVQMIFGPIVRDVTVDPELDEPSGNTVILARMSRFLDGDYQELWDLSRSVPPPKKSMSSAAAKQKRARAHCRNADYSKTMQVLRWLGVIC